MDSHSHNSRTIPVTTYEAQHEEVDFDTPEEVVPDIAEKKLTTSEKQRIEADVADEKKILFEAIGVEPIKNNYKPAQILEMYDTGSIREFWGRAYDRIDEGMVATLKKALIKDRAGDEGTDEDLELIASVKEQTVAKLLEESAGNAGDKPTKARFERALKPDTTGLEKLGLCGNDEMRAKVAEMIVSGQIRVAGEDLVPAHETETSRKAVEALNGEIISSLRSELVRETRESLMKAPDLLLEHSQTYLDQLKKQQDRVDMVFVDAFNKFGDGKEGEHINLVFPGQNDISSIEQAIGMYRRERKEELDKLAALKVMLIEGTAGFDQADGRTAFTLAEMMTALDKEAELASENKYAEFLTKTLAEKSTAKKHNVIVSSHEHDMTDKEQNTLAGELRKSFWTDMAGRLEPERTEGMEAEFFEGSANFASYVAASVEQHKVMKQIEYMRDQESTMDGMRSLRHMMNELLLFDAKKDHYYQRAAEEFGHLVCEKKREAYAGTLTPAEAIAVKSDYDKVTFDPKGIEITIVPEGTIQTPEISKVDRRKLDEYMIEERLKARDASRIRIAKKMAGMALGYLKRKWNIHK